MTKQPTGISIQPICKITEKFPTAICVWFGPKMCYKVLFVSKCQDDDCLYMCVCISVTASVSMIRELLTMLFNIYSA